MKILYTAFGFVLREIYGFVGNYGWSIVIFALFAKLITFPLVIKQTRSSQMMRYLNPEIEKINQRYKGNKNKIAEESMKIYEKYNYNPMGGCLPLLIQMPILIGLFGVIREPAVYVFPNMDISTISMSFLWVENLSATAMDIVKEFGFTLPTLLAAILPILNVLAMFVNQNITAATSGQSMGETGTLMTLFISVYTVVFSQGLVLYWVSQTVFGVLQTIFIEKFLPAKNPLLEGSNANDKKNNK